MKKFQYNLENVLKLKKFNEEECKMALGLAISILNEIENKIKETAIKHHHASSEIFKDPSKMTTWNNYIMWLDQEKEKLLKEAAEAEIVVEEKRVLYMEAFKEHKVLENNKEKKKDEYRIEAEKIESEEVDEIYANMLKN